MESDRNEEEGHGGGKRGAPRSSDAIGWGCCATILLNPPSREKNLMGESKVVEEKVRSRTGSSEHAIDGRHPIFMDCIVLRRYAHLQIF
jgi:hypothetical protein